jgi:hypothetical protein
LKASKGDKTALALCVPVGAAMSRWRVMCCRAGWVQREDLVYGLQRVVQRIGDVLYTVVDRFIDTGRSIIAQGYDVATIRRRC